jgi:nucleoside-diphosphate-sugar epimerase
MKIVITGSNGFVGKNLGLHFKNFKGFEVKFLNVRIPFSADDITNSDVLIHLAGKAHDLKKTSSDDEYFRVNTDLTRRLFDLFLKSKVKDFIYFSSVKAVADTVDGELTEDIEPRPITAYGQSKLLAERYLLSKILPEGKRLFILRPCMIHGPGNKGNLNLLYKVVEKGVPYPLAAYHNQRSFLSIANLNYIIERLITDGTISSDVFNVADDEALATNEVIKVISLANRSKPRLWKISKVLVNSLAKVGDLLHLPLNTERLQKLTESYVVSNAKIKAALGINKLPLTVKDGLTVTIKSFSAK